MGTVWQGVRLAWRLWGAYRRAKRSARRARRAFRKALQSGGVPREGVEELAREFDAGIDHVFGVVRHLTGRGGR